MICLRGFACGIPVVCLLAALPAHAQESRGEVFGGFLAGKEIGRRNCSPAGVTITPCSPWKLGWNGSFAVHASDRWSLVGTVVGLHESLDAEITIQEPSPTSIPFSASADTFAFAGGVRLKSDWTGGAVRRRVPVDAGDELAGGRMNGDRAGSVQLFIDILYGYSRTDGTLETVAGMAAPDLGDDLAGWDTSGPMFMPGLGADVAVSDRVAVRFQAHLPFLTELRLGAGLVFSIGD